MSDTDTQDNLTLKIEDPSEGSLRPQDEYVVALHETTLALMNRLDPAALLETIVERAARLVGTEHGFIYLWDVDALEVRIGVGIFTTMVGHRLRSGEGLAGKVLESGETLAVEDYHSWSGRSASFDDGPNQVGAVVGVPIRSGQSVTGVIALAYLKGGRRFGADEIESLGRFAQLASIALDNARLYALAQQEVSEHRRSERLLANSRDQLRAIIGGIADGVTVQDPDGRLVYANDTAARLLGYPSAEAMLDAPPGEILGRFEIVDEAGKPFELENLPGRRVLRGDPSPAMVLGFRNTNQEERRWAVVNATLLPDEHGSGQLAVNHFSDITARKRSEDANRFLAESSEMLSSSLDYETTLKSVAQLAVPDIADWCAVDIVEVSGTVQRLAVAHVNPEKVQLAQEMGDRYPVDLDAPSGLASVLRSGRSEYYPDIPQALLERTARDADHLRILRELGLRSAITAPLVTGGRVLGAITLVSAESGRRYDHEDLRLAEDLGQRAAQAIENARLFTEIKRAEEALRASETRFRTVIEQSPLSVQIFASDGSTVQVNRAWEKLWGVTLDQIPGYNVLQDPQLVEKGLMPYIHQAFAGVAAEIPPIQYVPDETIPDVSGVPYRWVRAFVYPVKDEGGGVREVVLVHEDITEQQVAEEQLQFQANILRNVRDSVIVTDLNGTIQYWNEGASTIFGYRAEEMLGQTPSILYPERSPEQFAADLGPIMHGQDYMGEWRGRRKDGTDIWVHIKTTLMRDSEGHGVGFIGVAADITERKRVEDQRDALLTRVQEALDLRNQFLSIASHELGTPVTLLKGYAQMLQQQAERQGNASLLRPLEVMSRQTDRMASLIEELLTVSRIERGQMELEMDPFDLNTALRDTIDEIGLTTSGFVLHLDEQCQHLWVRGDRARIQRVLTNLLNNAIKYSKQRQEISISIRRDEMRAVVSVTDYGIGIPEHQQPHVFDLYFRAENAPTKHYAGLGLGMYISKNIIDRHGGTIGLSSVEGKGSTFWFALPLMDTPAVESKDTPETG